MSDIQFKHRPAYLFSSWLGPVVALVGIELPIKVISNFSSTISNENNNPIFIIAGLIIVVAIYLALFASPWVTYKAKKIGDFKQIHAFSVAVGITMILSPFLSYFEITWPLRNLSIFVLSRWILMRIYKRAEQGESAQTSPLDSL